MRILFIVCFWICFVALPYLIGALAEYLGISSWFFKGDLFGRWLYGAVVCWFCAVLFGLSYAMYIGGL